MLLAGYLVLEDLVSIYNICRSGRDNKDRDKTVPLWEHLRRTKGRYFDLDCFALTMVGPNLEKQCFQMDMGPYQYGFSLKANHDQFAKSGILLEELRYAALDAYYLLLVMFVTIRYGMAHYLLMQMQVFNHDRMEPKQINNVACHFYQQYSAIPGRVNREMGLGSQAMETEQVEPNMVYHMMKCEMYNSWAV
uniref:Uncharacterized protein n=1 Tax=Romanomermis culicivorax TaxID=13658 RepID=A0A915JDR0_ROMCU